MMGNHSFDTTCLFLRMDVQAAQEVYASFIASIVLNITSAIPTILFNTLLITAILRTQSLHSTPSSMLLCSLAFTDLGVGMVVQPFFVAKYLTEIHGNFPSFCWTGMTLMLSAGVFLNCSSYIHVLISIDRCLAVHLGMRYRSTVTKFRVTLAIIIVWVFAVLVSASQLIIGTGNFFRLLFVLIFICSVIITCAYTKAFRALKRHQAQVSANDTSPTSFGTTRDLKRYRKSLVTMMQILGLILLSYLPYFGVAAAIAMKGHSVQIKAAKSIASVLGAFHSFLSPCVCIWKIGDIRHACRHELRKALHLTIASPEGGESTEGTRPVTMQVEPVLQWSQSKLEHFLMSTASHGTK